MLLRRYIVFLLLLALCSSCAKRQVITTYPDFRQGKDKRHFLSSVKQKRVKNRSLTLVKSKRGNIVTRFEEFEGVKSHAPAPLPVFKSELVFSANRCKPLHLKSPNPIISTRANRYLTKTVVKELGKVPSAEDKCDKLFTYDKKEIICIVKEITDSQIMFIPCDDQASPVKSINKSEVRVIEFSDGRIKVVDKASRTTKKAKSRKNGKDQNRDQVRRERWLIFGIIAGGLLFIYLLLWIFVYLTWRA